MLHNKPGFRFCSATITYRSPRFLHRHQSFSSDDLYLLLQQCSTPRQAKQLHAQLLHLSMDDSFRNSSSYLYARLVSVYSCLGFLSDADGVFHSSPQPRNSLLWNSILRANVANGFPLEASRLYRQMRNTTTYPDGFTYPLAIRASAALRHPKLCFSVHAHSVISGYHENLHVANELVVMYGDLGWMDLAQKVFDPMPLRNTISWNSLISGFAMNHDCENANNIFGAMKAMGPQPNSVTWTSLLSANARCRRHEEVISLFNEMREKGVLATPEAVAVALSVCPYVSGMPLDKGKEIHGYVCKSGFEGYSFVKNSLICMYGKLGWVDDAETLFVEMKVKNLVSWNALISSYAASGLCNEAYDVFSQLESKAEVTPNLVSWSAMIGGFATQGMVQKSLELFQRMVRSGIMPNPVTLATVLMVCAELSSLRLGKETHGHTVKMLMDKNILVGNGLINMYNKSGNVFCGRLVFDMLKEKDLVTWNSMIAGYAMNGLWAKAFSIFHKMADVGVQPDEITFLSLLSACSHAGCVTDGREIFDQMLLNYKLSPSVEHYACMVDLHARAGLMGEAIELIERMPVKPNACVWSALLNSCRVYGNTALAEDSAVGAFGLEADDTGSYMLLSNIYAASGKWEDSRRVRSLTKEKGLKKNPGNSWIEVKEKIHVFSSGCALSIGAEAFEVLDYLNRSMEIGISAPELSVPFHGLDLDKKLAAVCV